MHERGDVENQSDTAIAQNSGSGNERVILERITKAFDDNFLFADQFVNEKAALRAVRFDDHNDCCRRIRIVGSDR